MDKFEKAILNYFIAGGYKEVFYNVEMHACGDDVVIAISDRIKGDPKINVTIHDETIFVVIFCHEDDFSITIIERFAEIVNLKLIKVNAK